MTKDSSNTKRLVKNTAFLYFRMLFLMLISLYTSRVVLKSLGVEDYGIYNAVGGFITLFDVFTHSLSAAISRFITFELGAGNKERLRAVFSTTIIIQLIISVGFILLAETGGLWFLKTQMTIPEGRETAAFWVFQFSLITFVLKLLSVPYNASIIAHEKMGAFAYISMIDGGVRLVIAFIIAYTGYDRLIMYAFFLCVLAAIIRIIYNVYSKRKFEECSFSFIYDKKLFKEIFGFAGWNFIGGASGVLNNHGVNILLNVFCGPAVNAARGIAVQVNNAVLKFVESFMTAIRPQITKSYANGDRSYMMKLIIWGSRLSGYILIVMGIPILLETDEILSLWLVEVPDYTVVFVQLVIINSIIESLSYTLITAMLATGDIKNYQITVGGLNMLGFPLAYIVLKMGFEPYYSFIMIIVVSLACLAARLKMLRQMIDLPIRIFTKEVIFNLLKVVVISIILPYILHKVISQGLPRLFVVSCCSIVSSLIIIILFGFSNVERIYLMNKIKQKIR